MYCYHIILYHIPKKDYFISEYWIHIYVCTIQEYFEANELAKWLIGVHALTEDPGSVPHTHMVAHNQLTPFQNI